MKKTVSILIVIMLIMTIFTGCASQDSTESTESTESSKSNEITKIEDLQDKTVGTIVWFGMTDDALVDVFSKHYGSEIKAVKSFDTESALVMALDTGKIDAAWLRDFQAKTYAKDTDKYSVFANDSDKALAGSARMAAAKGSEAEKDISKINEAIAKLEAGGTLAQLQKEYIDEFDFSKNYDSIEMPKIDGAPTYKISISGSMVPLDYIAADGKPTGYSIALLSKISELANINFELVTVGIGTDRMELTSNKIDYIFCYTLTDENMKKDTELIFSEPYFSYEGSAFLIKK